MMTVTQPHTSNVKEMQFFVISWQMLAVHRLAMARVHMMFRIAETILMMTWTSGHKPFMVLDNLRHLRRMRDYFCVTV